MFRDDLFAGGKVLITGGGTGLGRAMAERIAALGGNLVICGRREGVLRDAAEAMRAAYGVAVDTYPLDIRDQRAVEDMLEDVFARGPLTGLVNNAAGNFIARTEDLSVGGFEAIARIVMHGTFYVTQGVGKRWIAGGHTGSVVSIVTTWVRHGSPYIVPSAMAKSAVHAMTMSLAAEWGHHGIRLNAIAPGEIPTEGMNKRLTPGMEPGERTRAVNPMGRTGTLDEIANLCAFLLADGCGWLTGETIALDGAQHLALAASHYMTLREWGDAEWREAREAIRATNTADRAGR